MCDAGFCKGAPITPEQRDSLLGDLQGRMLEAGLAAFADAATQDGLEPASRQQDSGRAAEPAPSGTVNADAAAEQPGKVWPLPCLCKLRLGCMKHSGLLKGASYSLRGSCVFAGTSVCLGQQAASFRLIGLHVPCCWLAFFHHSCLVCVQAREPLAILHSVLSEILHFVLLEVHAWASEQSTSRL